MSLKAGIVGLPNVGKSTLFNAMTKSKVEAANYPFATINPNIGVVTVSDPRLDWIYALYPRSRKINATIEFYDIAGLVRGASQGEGLGNQFLAHIREVDAICHVVRCFEDPNITHVEEGVDPRRDIEIVKLELIFADLQNLENRLQKIERRAKANEKEAQLEYRLAEQVRQELLAFRLPQLQDLNKEESAVIKSFNLLTGKPVIYVANMKEEDLGNFRSDKYYSTVKEIAETEGNKCIAISAKLDDELTNLDEETKRLFMEELKVESTGLDKMIQTTYTTLGLGTFFTIGDDETRAWTFKKGQKAPECAGLIHSDFARGFIKVEAYTYDDLVLYGNEAKVKEHGKLRIEGKDYQVQDGDILFFRFNV